MKQNHYFINGAICILASSALAFATSFKPEFKSQDDSSKKESFVEKTLNTKAGIIQSYGWQKQNSPVKAASDVTINVAVTGVDGYEVNTSAIGIIDESTKSLAVNIAADEQTGVLPTSAQASLDSEHSYSAIAFGELVSESGTKAVAYFTDVEINDGVINLNVDFNACNRQVAYQAKMGNGEEYPTYKPWSEGCGYNLTYGSSLTYATYSASFRVDNPMTFRVYCNEFPGTTNYSISYMANLFDERVYSSISGGGTLNEFEDPINMVEMIPVEFYDDLSFTMSLSPKDMEIGKETFIQGSKQDLATIMENGKFGLQTNTLSMGFNDPTRKPVDSYSCYTWIPSSRIATNVWTSMVYTGFGAYNSSDSKFCGARTRVFGTLYILPWEQSWNETYETYTPYSSISQLNIKPAEQDIQNFKYPLYANSQLIIVLDPDDASMLKSISPNAHYYGMFNEYLNLSGVSLLKSMTAVVNGEETETLTTLKLSEISSLDFTFYNPDGYVQGEFETENINVLHVTTTNPSDMIPPRMTGLQMYDGDGKIKTKFEADEECNLLVVMHDRTTDNTASLDFGVKLYAAAQESDEWVEISTVDVTDHAALLGKECVFTIPTDGTLAANKWLKLKVVGEDTSGNTNTMNLDYCLYIDDPSGVDRINADNAESTPVYYNLQGMRVVNPAAGEIVIEKTGNKARKVML